MDMFKNTDINIEAPRLTLKTLTRENADIEAYVSWLNDPEILQYLEVRHAPKQTNETIRAFIAAQYESADNVLFGMFLNDDGRHIGNIKLGPVNKRYARADIGLIIGDKESWGKGFATEAIGALSGWAFTNTDLIRLQAGAYGGNTGSIKAFEKAGFTVEGRQESYWQMDDGTQQDNILVGLTRAAFQD